MEHRSATEEAHRSALRTIVPFGFAGVLGLFLAPAAFALVTEGRVSSGHLQRWVAALWLAATLQLVVLLFRRSMLSLRRWEQIYSWVQVFVGASLGSAFALDVTEGEPLTYHLMVVCLLLAGTSFGGVAFAGSATIGRRYLSGLWLTTIVIGTLQGTTEIVGVAAVVWPTALMFFALTRREVARSAKHHQRARDLAKELAVQASTDGLTGLLNRRTTLQRIQQTLDAGHGVTALFIDIDGFKELNDRYGHATGDTVLINVAEQLKQVARDGDIVGRLGGDEFIVVLTEPADQHLADVIADRFAGEVARSHGAISELAVTASVGAARSVDGLTAEDLLGCADTAMHRAKCQGGNSAVHFLQSHLD